MSTEYTALEQRIIDAAQKYYTDGSSDLSDKEFDQLINRLRVEKPDSDLLKKVGWGYSIALDTTPGATVKHHYGDIGSLTKVHNWEEINKEFRKLKKYDRLDLNFLATELDVSLKLDGLSCVCYYQEGHLVQALTRGEDNYGKDITAKVKLLIPEELPCDPTFTGAVRGEILMKNSMWKEYKEKYPEAKNSRNSSVGIINGDSNEDVPFLSFVAYTRVALDTPYCRQSKDLHITGLNNWLEYNFELVAPRTQIRLSSTDYFETLNELMEDWSTKEYRADGLVLTLPIVYYDYETKCFNYNSVAFKFKSEEKETVVTEVEWNLSKSGYMVPKLKFGTIELADTMVSQCTGYNAKFIKDNEIGVGSRITVEKRGEIIPNMNDVVYSTGAELPTRCAECGHELEWDGVHLACKNPNCVGADMKDLLEWMRYLAPIDKLGDTLKTEFLNSLPLSRLDVDHLMCYENIHSLCEIYPDDGVQWSLFKQALRRINYELIPVEDALRALNIPRLGKKLSELMGSDEEFIRRVVNDAMQNRDLSWTASIIGIANAKSLNENKRKLRRLRYIIARLTYKVKEENEAGGDLVKVAVTGKLSVARKEFENELRGFGFLLSDISKDTKYLITDNPTGSSSKNKFADKNSIEKISESEFRAKYFK